MAEAQQLEEAVQSVQAQTDWGPPDQATNLCLRSLGVPYAPYAKSDRLGKIADWVGPSTRAQNNTQQSQAQQLRLRPDALTPGAGLGTGGGAASAGLQSTAGGSGASQTASSTAAVPSASSSTSAATAAAAAQGAVPSAVGVATDGSGSTAESAESEYTFVDNRPAPKSGRGWQQRGGPGAGGRGGRGGAQGGRGPQHTSGPQSGAAAAAAGGAWGAGPPGQRGAAGPAAGGRGEAQAPQGRKQQFQGGRGQGDRRENVVQYSPSVEVRPDWNVLEQVQLSQLTKLSYDVKDVEDLKMCGRLFRYNKMLDRASPRAEKRLQKFQNVQFPNPTTSDDPYIRELADNDEGSVFITDSVLATIMCATRSVFSWDVVVTKSGNKLWFDKRRKSNFDQLTVHETAQQGSQLVEGYESINRVQPLCEEATSTNANFSQMALDTSSPVYELGEETPFVDEAERDRTAPKVFRYRRWKLEEGVGVVVRTEIDCLCELRGEEVFGLTKSVNEFDPRWTGMDWRKKIETQRGAVLATELKNNANKLAKWTCQAILADASLLKLGYVSRQNPRNNKAHSVVQIQTYKPFDFATQINLSNKNMWGIFKSIVDICRKQEDGKYLLVKDPNKALLRLYEVPEDSTSILEDDGDQQGDNFTATEAPPE